MITVFYGPVKCKCCTSGPHGYGRPSSSPEVGDTTLLPGTRFVPERANEISPAAYAFMKATKVFQHRVETGTYRVVESA